MWIVGVEPCQDGLHFLTYVYLTAYDYKKRLASV
jgi:hypothetical protein